MLGSCRTFPALLLCLFFLCSALYGILGPRALPGSDVFALLTLAVSAYLAGSLLKCLKLPPLVGMLMVGILFRNVNIPFFHIPKDTSETLRVMSLVIILLKAGLGLDSVQLKSLRWVVVRLSLLPCLTEAATDAVLSHLLLGLPWIWSLMLGFIVSAVSAAILVPEALSLERNGRGMARGVPTLLLASVSLDNILALTGFVVLFSTITTYGSNPWLTLLQRLLEPCLGLLLGTAFGILLWFIPNTKDTGPSVVCYRTMLLCLGGLALTFLSRRMGVSGVGALGCVSIAFTASLRWRKDTTHFQNITWITEKMWQCLEPFLFSLVGAEVTLDTMRRNIGLDTLVLVGGLLLRGLATWLALLGSRLNVCERVFVCLSWISKATVQAAVGSEALDYSRTEDAGPQFEEFGKKVLSFSVISILITAPLGAALMALLESRLLARDCTPVSEAAKVKPNYGTCCQESSPA